MQIIQRQVNAVGEWLTNTNYSLHGMRDHPNHIAKIMGGLWGARINDQNRKKWMNLIISLLNKAHGSKIEYNLDRYLLSVRTTRLFLFLHLSNF